MDNLSEKQIARKFDKMFRDRKKEYDKLPICNDCKERHREEPCEHCIEVKTEQEASRLNDIKRLGGIKAYEDFTPKLFDNKELMNECSELYINNNLFLWGKTGTGKSHLATAILRMYKYGWVVKPQSIMRECRFLRTPQEEQNAINKYITMDNIVIDDLGSGKITATSLSIIYEIIEGRVMNKKKGMIITSNLSLDALADYFDDDRVVSRIVGMAKIKEVTGKDHRLS